MFETFELASRLADTNRKKLRKVQKEENEIPRFVWHFDTICTLANTCLLQLSFDDGKIEVRMPWKIFNKRKKWFLRLSFENESREHKAWVKLFNESELKVRTLCEKFNKWEKMISYLVVRNWANEVENWKLEWLTIWAPNLIRKNERNEGE